MTDKRCGTCDHWEFGQRSYCSWAFFPGALAVSSAYKAGGECHAMWGDDGKDCPTWIVRNAPQGNSMKRQRPPMPPLSVRVQVAERQFLLMPTNDGASVYNLLIRDMNQSRRLQWLRYMLFSDGRNETSPHALDHDPALILRPYNPRIKDVAARYTPHAHDPAALIYREKADHQQKTTGRKPGAERTVTTLGSDIHLKTKFARLEGRTKKRPKARIAQRKNPWPKRKMR